MDEFYKNIVATSRAAKIETLVEKSGQEQDRKPEDLITTRYTDEIIKLLTAGCKKNISLAASKGLRHAYISLIGKDAQYNGAINILAMIFPDASLEQRYRETGHKTVLEKMRELFKPFEVSCEKISDVSYAVKISW